MVKSGGNAKKQISDDNAIGKVYLVEGKAGANTEVVKITQVDTRQLTTRYVYYTLWSLRHRIQEEAKYTTGLGHLDMTGFQNIEVPLLPLEEQDKLTSKLTSLDHNINLTKQKIEADKEYMKILLETETMGCEKVRLGNLVTLKGGKFMSNEMSNKGDIPFYTSSAANPVGVHDIESFNAPEYILIVTAGGVQNDPGGKHGMGRVYYINGKSACRSTVKALFVKEDVKTTCLSKYLFYYLQAIRGHINSYAKFTTNLGTITNDTLLDVLVALPDVEQQAHIVQQLNDIDTQTTRLSQHLVQMEELKRTLLT
jgi:restriction endonuclease S subunit